MAQAFECTACGVRWDPFMTVDGACPTCNGGTKRVQGPASAEAAELHKAALAERIKRERSEHAHAQFRAYLVQRQIAADAARFAEQDTEEIAAEVIRREFEDDDTQWGEEDVAA